MHTLHGLFIVQRPDAIGTGGTFYVMDATQGAVIAGPFEDWADAMDAYATASSSYTPNPSQVSFPWGIPVQGELNLRAIEYAKKPCQSCGSAVEIVTPPNRCGHCGYVQED